MRPLLLCVLLLGAAHAGPADRWVKVFSSFFSQPHEEAANYYGEITEPTHIRIKRAVYAALGITSVCGPGWTGQFCENPICDKKGTASISGNTDKLIEEINAPSGCGGQYYVPVDSASTQYLFIKVATDAAPPYINLTDASGAYVQYQSTFSSTGLGIQDYHNIPPGKYQLTVNTKGLPTKFCTIEIHIASDLDFTHGFVASPYDDFPPSGPNAVEGQMMNLVVYTPPELNAQIGSATIFRDTNSTSPILRSTLTRRYGCAYDYFVGGTFTCDKSSGYQLTVDGIDANGFAFRRSKAGTTNGRWTCVSGPPTAPPTTPAPVVTCMNGGTLLYGHTSNARCLCTELFTGPECQYAQCMNGGALNPLKTSCECPVGYSGINCQDVICNPNFEDFITSSKTLIIVLRAVQSMNQYVNAIVAKVQAEYDYMAQTPGMEPYREFVLIAFANGNFDRTKYTANEFTKFKSALAAYNATSTTGNCNDTNILAIQEVLRVPLYNKSPIYVFTDAPASDYSDFLGVTEANAFKKLPIFTFFMNTTAAQSCGVDEISEGYRIMGTLAYMSGGLVFSPSNGNFPTTLALAIRSTTYKMNQVLIDDLSVCRIDGYRTFFADSATKTIHIVATGENLLLAVTDPNGKVTSPQIFQDGRNYFYTIPAADVVIGEYLLEFVGYDTQYPCSYRVYAHSDYDVFIAATDFVAEDASSPEPVHGRPMAMVAQMNGLYNKTGDPFRLFAEIMIVSNDNGVYHKPLYFGSGIYRTGCGYHLYFGRSNFCEYIGQVFYAIVYADDPYGYTIQRTAVGYCSGRPPTQEPPSTCVNGGVPNPANASQCLCPPSYTGRYCQDLNCQNGGQYTQGRCVCPSGLGGSFCEETACLATNTNPAFNPDARSLTFVVSTIPSMNNTWQKLSSGVSDFVKDVQIHGPNWISLYNLVLVNQDGATLVKSTSRAQGFIDAIQAVAKDLPNFYNANNTDCKVKLQSGLLTAAQNSFQRSFIFAFLDSDARDDEGLVLGQLLANVESKQVQISIVGTATTICPDGYFNKQVDEIVVYSGGWLYQTTNIAEMLNFVLTEYQSGTIADYYREDCTTPQDFYLPVDGLTQSMTIVANGQKPNVTVFQPDGVSARNSHYELRMLTEDHMIMDQFMIPCPNSEWEYNRRNCYLSVLTTKNYYNASNDCHALGGYLIDVLSQDKQDYVQELASSIDLWLGLVLIGGQWSWDSPDQNQHLPLAPDGYSNWKGGVTPTDPANGCAIKQKDDGLWVAVPCTNRVHSVCQRHRYGQDIYPGDSYTNLLPGGYWKATVQTASGSCWVQARVQSKIQLYFGFVQDTHSDFPELYANSNASNNYFVVGATGLPPFHNDRNPTNAGRLNYVYTGSNRTAYNALTFEDRAGCAYTMLSQNFSCKNQGSYYDQFFARFSGVDQYGFTFERFSSAYCGRQVSTCDNGGYIYQGQCVCPETWIGRRCSIPVCLNGGVVNAQDKCVCPAMFSGTWCELAHCEPPYPATFGDKQRTLAIAIETSTLMKTSIFLLKKNLGDIIANITTSGPNAGWFNNYILYPFDSTINQDQWYAPIGPTTNFDDIVAGIGNLKGCPNKTCDNHTCPRPYLRVVSNIIKMKDFASPNSELVVITRSSPEDYNILSSVIGDIQNSRARVYFVLPATSSPCNDGWDTPAADAIRTIAAYSGGGIYTVSPPELTFNWFQQYFPATYRSGRVEGGSVSQNCSNAEALFPVENAATQMVVEYFGAAINLKLYDPMNEEVSLPASLVQSTTNYIGIIQLDDSGATRAGTWRLTTQDPGATFCLVDVRLRSRTEIYPSYTQVNDAYGGATNDDAHFQPVVGDNNIVLVHAAGLSEGARVQYAQIVLPRRGLFFTSEMRRRSRQCGYEYYSTKSFECFMENFLVVIYGTDERGAAFNRVFVSHCISNRPRPLPPPPFCDITQTKNDIVFMIDGSAASRNVIGVFKLFINYVMRGYSVGPTSTQGGAFTFSVAAPGSNPVMLNSAADIDTFTNKIHALIGDGATGQNISQAINYVSSMYTRTDMGYRTGSDVKHLVVYITASTSYTDGGVDPIEAVRSLKRGGAFGFAVVSLGITTPPDYLASMAGPQCSYYAQEDNDLAEHGANLIQSFSCFRFPICGM